MATAPRTELCFFLGRGKRAVGERSRRRTRREGRGPLGFSDAVLLEERRSSLRPPPPPPPLQAAGVAAITEREAVERRFLDRPGGFVVAGQPQASDWVPRRSPSSTHVASTDLSPRQASVRNGGRSGSSMKPSAPLLRTLPFVRPGRPEATGRLLARAAPPTHQPKQPSASPFPLKPTALLRARQHTFLRPNRQPPTVRLGCRARCAGALHQPDSSPPPSMRKWD